MPGLLRCWMSDNPDPELSEAMTKEICKKCGDERFKAFWHVGTRDNPIEVCFTCYGIWLKEQIGEAEWIKKNG